MDICGGIAINLDFREVMTLMLHSSVLELTDVPRKVRLWGPPIIRKTAPLIGNRSVFAVSMLFVHSSDQFRSILDAIIDLKYLYFKSDVS